VSILRSPAEAWPDVLVAAAVVPATPLLVPAVAGSTTGAGDELLRSRTMQAVRTSLDAAPERVVVVAPGATTGPVTGRWSWTTLGVPLRAGAGPWLDLASSVGDWLLDEVGWSGDREHHCLAPDAGVTACVSVGRLWARDDRRTALLVLADGSARRSVKAPGCLDPRAEQLDAQISHALRTADAEALLALDAALAQALLVAGLGPLQALAAAAGGRMRAELLHDEAPYGVGYFVATWCAERTVSAATTG
jgi:hypothetical protein